MRTPVSPPALVVLAAGPGVTVQDGGRHGWLRYGITPAGPMDPLAHATANLAAGNGPGAAAVEVSVGGLEVTAEGAALAVALAGGSFRISLDGRALPPAVALALEPGARLRIAPGLAGSWCTLAVAGGLDVAPVLGSAATHTRSGLGGHDGRALRAGDRLLVAGAHPTAAEACPPAAGAHATAAGAHATAPDAAALVAPWLERPSDVVRVVLGPQDDHFAPDQVAAFLDHTWTVSARGDRMAAILEGAPLRHRRGHDIVSDGVAAGSVQVPGDGRPIVLMADRQPTGGYPKIACVIGADLGRLAQARAGARVRFRAVSVAEAVAARREEAACLARAIARAPLVRTAFASEFLLGLNLVDGVVDAVAAG